jgi:hypothetical protein
MERQAKRGTGRVAALLAALVALSACGGAGDDVSSLTVAHTEQVWAAGSIDPDAPRVTTYPVDIQAPYELVGLAFLDPRMAGCVPSPLHVGADRRTVHGPACLTYGVARLDGTGRVVALSGVFHAPDGTQAALTVTLAAGGSGDAQ